MRCLSKSWSQIMSITETKIENTINELLNLLEQEDVQRDLLLSAN